MTDAVIVSTARTPIGRAFRGAFNNTHGATLGGHVVAEAVKRAKVDPDEVEDVLMGCAMPEGATGGNIAPPDRPARRAPGLGAGRDRQPLLLVGPADHRHGRAAHPRRTTPTSSSPAASRSISLVQGNQTNQNVLGNYDAWIKEHAPAVYWPMIQTADNVAKRYKISREAQDEYGLESQRRTAAAQQAAPLRCRDRAAAPPKSCSTTRRARSPARRCSRCTKDEGNRPDTNIEGLAKLKPVAGEGNFITAGNASQLSDGASACVVMSDKEAQKRGLDAARHLSRLRGRGLRARRDGHRPDLRRAEAAEEARPQGRGHRHLGAERGVRGAGDLLPRQARHSRTTGSTSMAAPSRSATPTA